VIYDGQWIAGMLTRGVLRFLQFLARLPLPVLRCLGLVAGVALYGLVSSRRRVVWINLQLCFPHWTRRQVRACAVMTFVHFAQSWLDRGWIWYASPEVTRRRIRLTGAVEGLQGTAPTILFAPHFIALDAGWTGVTQQIDRKFNTIYTDQANKDSDAWILKGRSRYGNPGLFGRVEGVKAILHGLKQGAPLYLLPDMNFGPHESVWVPFYGVPAATVPSLSRFARLTKAQVVPVISLFTSYGYEVRVLPAWTDFPTHDATADTALMNARLQTYIDEQPNQYYWVHKRFKDQPAGVTPPY